jgi:hypothetical protein
MAQSQPKARIRRYGARPPLQLRPVSAANKIVNRRVRGALATSYQNAQAGQALVGAYQKANPGVPLPNTTVPPAAQPSSTAAVPPAVVKPSVQDPTFLAWQAGKQFEMTQTKQGYDAADRADTLARAEALRRLGAQRPAQVRQTNESFNRAGLFYSGQLGRAQDENTAGYTQQQGDIGAKFDAAAEARRAARAALDQGYPLEVAAQMAAAADRRIAADTQLADAGALAPTPVTKSIAKAKVTSPAGKPKPKPSSGGNAHKRSGPKRTALQRLARGKGRSRQTSSNSVTLTLPRRK